MNRSKAATTLLLWQIEGHGDVVAEASRDDDRPLEVIVQDLEHGQSSLRRPAPERPEPPVPEFLRLEEEREVESLRERLDALRPVLRPEEVSDWESRLADDVLPRARIASLREELEHLGSRLVRETIHRDLEVIVTASATPWLHSIMLFSRDGRLLAGEGEVAGLDASALATLAARAEPGSTWTLAHRAGFLVGHRGERVAIVALFANRPPPNVGPTLRASLGSLEKRPHVLNVPDSPTNHQALNTYIRAVRLLLMKGS